MKMIGKFVFEIGIIFVIIGIILIFFDKIPIFRLPGDIVIKKDHATIYIPIVTSIILSIILTLLLNLIFRK
jgi:uncharacterized membrane protein YidH (DUF202 family)